MERADSDQGSVRIVVEDLPDDGRRLQGERAITLPGEDGTSRHGDEISMVGPVAYDLWITRLGSTATVVGGVEAVVKSRCSRCAKPFEIPVDRHFNAVFVTPDSGETDHRVELDEKDLDLDYYEGDSIDVLRLLGEQIVLELPMKALCSDECVGLCPNCGADRNRTTCDCEPNDADPRWDALKSLRDQI